MIPEHLAKWLKEYDPELFLVQDPRTGRTRMIHGDQVVCVLRWPNNEFIRNVDLASAYIKNFVRKCDLKGYAPVHHRKTAKQAQKHFAELERERENLREFGRDLSKDWTRHKMFGPKVFV